MSADGRRSVAAIGLAVLAVMAAILQFVTMFLSRAQGRYSEDFLTTYRRDVYFGQSSESSRGPYLADAFLFLYPAILELLCLVAVAGVALMVLIRPDWSGGARRYAVLAGLALVAVAVLNVVSPSWGVIEFKTLAASYVALAAAGIASGAAIAATVVAARSG